MLNFREIRYDQDIPEIIELLNNNFDSTHTKNNFIWKHLENPFGKSYGLLAIDNGQIVGLRMFMRWEFLSDKKVIKGIRPVDTCTDHKYRGHGLFKKLTLEGLENLKTENSIIFNTPNSNSKPGYLKMGWSEIENGEIYKLGILNIFVKSQKFDIINSSKINLPKLNTDFSGTLISSDFLKWRYKSDEFKIAQFEDGGIIIYKLSKLKGIKTIILYDSFENTKKLKNYVSSISRFENTKMIYFLDNIKNKQLNILLAFKRNVQVVVFRDDLEEIAPKLQFSLGDLEGRL